MTNPASRVIIYLAFAGVAHLVERDLAKVEVASSSLVARSRKAPSEKMVLSFLQTAPRTRCLDLRAAREIIRGEAGLPRMAIAIRGMPGSEFEPRRPLQRTPSEKMVLFFCRQPRELAASTCAQRVKSYEVRQGSCEWPLPFVGCREASSSLVARSRKAPSEKMVLSFFADSPENSLPRPARSA